MRILASLLMGVTLAAQTAPTSLRQYLSLTDQQAAAIQKLDSDYSGYANAKQQRVGAIQQELLDVNRQDPADPQALGDRYLELELIRRDLESHLNDVRKQIAALLTPAQLTKLQALDAANRIQPLLNEALCAHLVQQQCPECFTIATVRAVVVATGVLSASQSQSSIGCSSGGAYALTQYLNLTDAQIASLMANDRFYADDTALKQDRIDQLRIEIRLETAKDQPDPMALGVRYAEILAINRDLADIATTRVESNRNLLTDDQKAKLKALEDARPLAGLAAEAQCANLLPPSQQQATNQWFDTSGFVFRSGDFACPISLTTP